eukprot:592220-Pelagomonas_calceolata.AAC.5
MLARERADAISAVLYPNDATPEGKELRLKQQYFFVTASLQACLGHSVALKGMCMQDIAAPHDTVEGCKAHWDVLARFKAVHGTSNWDLLPEKACFQLNDTHPTMAMAELTRLLVDVEGLSWEQGVKLTSQCLNCTNRTAMPEALKERLETPTIRFFCVQCLNFTDHTGRWFTLSMPEALEKWQGINAFFFAACMQCLNYTNHTVMPEALEKWPVKVLAKMLPRNLEIIEIIDEGWQKWLKEQGKSDEEVARMAIIHPNQWNKEEM